MPDLAAITSCDLNTMNKFISDQIAKIVEASQKRAAKENESDDSTTGTCHSGK